MNMLTQLLTWFYYEHHPKWHQTDREVSRRTVKDLPGYTEYVRRTHRVYKHEEKLNESTVPVLKNNDFMYRRWGVWKDGKETTIERSRSY